MPACVYEELVMKTEKGAKAAGVTANTRKYLFAAIIGIALVVLVWGSIQKGQPPAVSQASNTSLTTATDLAPAKPVYHKKALVFKRTLVETESPAIRESARYDGYQALAAIPPVLVVSQSYIRAPQFPTSFDMSNIQALSTLGTRQYYSNLDVQQYLTSLSTQQYLSDLSYRAAMNNLNTQQYLRNMNTWQNTTVLNAQTYLTNLNTQMSFNNMNNQMYLNNWNSMNTFRTFNNNWNTFSNPSYIAPPPRIYTPPIRFYSPPPSFNNFNFP